MTVQHYLWEARRGIDDVFGQGYAKAHPELVAAYIHGCTADVEAMVRLKATGEPVDA